MNRTTGTQVYWGHLLFIVACFLCARSRAADAAADAMLTNKTGIVLYKQKTRAAESISAPKNLYAEDLIHTSNDSMAVVSMRLDNTVVKLRELSTLEILPAENRSSTWLNLLRGALFLFSREDPKEVLIKTPHSTAAHKGTEFVITILEDRTLIVVLDGTATITNAFGKLELQSGEQGEATANARPTKKRIEAKNLVQWWLFYPGVLDVDELPFTEAQTNTLAASIQAYRAGDLAAALSSYPGYPAIPEPDTDSGRIYLAALYLATGEVDKTQDLLRKVSSKSSLAEALRWVIAAVQRDTDTEPEVHTSASEWLGLSYYYQARMTRDRMTKALEAAYQSVASSPRFAFGWERVAELEFGFGRSEKAKAALDRSLKFGPLNAQAHALNGFVLSSENHRAEARREFDEAIRLDPSLGNGWLGRGLLKIRSGDVAAGRADLRMAAILEPNRSLLRSYLGKVFAGGGENKSATLEFERAKSLDANDPTPWLYSALQMRDENKLNLAVGDLEKSIALNDNRAVYRSRLLLDADRAVRGANLAAIYQEVGMTGVSLAEAGNAVMSDYANYSAHLFLANSYNGLRDPNLINLRYESATFSEYLLANLLSPVGGSRLSPYVSQQEYSRLFDREGPGFSSQTTYLSSGDWHQQASLYGWQKNTGYAVDAYYRTQNGYRINNDLEQRAVSIQLKQQLTPMDSVYVQAIFSDYESGDVSQRYNQQSADPNLRVNEHQTPNLFFGYHHEWSPGVHTLLLAGLLEDKLTLSDRNISIPGVIRETNGVVVGTVSGIGGNDTFDALGLQSSFEAYSVELQQIARVSTHTFVPGARYQSGRTRTDSDQVRLDTGRFPPYTVGDFISTQSAANDISRLTIYGYDQWRVFDPLWLTAGVSYDELRFPQNVDQPPISDRERRSSQISPKAGFAWTPAVDTTFRGAFTRSLGGLFYDTSVRLEPVQISGFNQAYRSLSPAGAIAGSEFQTADLGFEQKFKSRTYVVAQLELLQSDAQRQFGAFDLVGDQDATPSQYRQSLEYEERSLSLSLNQLVGSDWSFGTHYKVSLADLETRYEGLPQALFPATHQSALLHTLDLHAIYNHRSGFFAEAQSRWRGQSNYHDDSNLAGDNFWQFNLFGGYRFPRRRAEVTVGFLNVTGQDYHLNPLSLYQELPRERTLLVSLKLNF